MNVTVMLRLLHPERVEMSELKFLLDVFLAHEQYRH